MAAVVTERGPASDPLRTLAIAHVLWAAWGLVGLGVTVVYIVTTWPMYDPAYLAANASDVPDFLLQYVPLMRAGGFMMAACQIAMMVLNALVARWLLQRRRWAMCAVVSGLNWISIPLGPVIGTWTLIVLNRPAVRASFV